MKPLHRKDKCSKCNDVAEVKGMCRKHYHRGIALKSLHRKKQNDLCNQEKIKRNKRKPIEYRKLHKMKIPKLNNPNK